MTIKLYELCGADPSHVFSPHCWKTRMSLAHKGLAFESVPTPFTAIAKTEDGDGRKVPVIRDGDKVVEESFEIARYLDETYPDTPKLLDGASNEALTRFFIQWSQTQVHPQIVALCLTDIHGQLAPTDQKFFRNTREKLFGKTLEEFQAQFDRNDPANLHKALLPAELALRNQPFICGDAPMFADYVLFGPLQWLRTIRGDAMLKDGSNVAAWFERLLDLYDGEGRNAVLGQAA